MGRRFHLMGIAGTGMGAFAGLLKQAGYEVRGSDENVYPPMSDQLAAWGIEVRTPYAAANLAEPVDLVVVGNVIRRTNLEAMALQERNLPHASFPQTLGELFLKDRHAVVVAGTHGKTTTSTLLAHVLLETGRDPGFLIGGVPQASLPGQAAPQSFRVGREASDSPFVVEGDEYDTAYFDKGPKFLHYHPRSLLCTSLEFDHADIYRDVGEIEVRFAQLMSLLPAAGHLVYFRGDASLQSALAQSALRSHSPPPRIESYGEEGADWHYTDVREDTRGVRFSVCYRNEGHGEVWVPLSGIHGVRNALGAYAILHGLGLSHDEIAGAYARFVGVKRRMEEVGSADSVTVVDDFAHHPTAVATTLRGARARYAGRPLWALFEPRSATSCRKVFQQAYAESFDAADRVLLAPTGRQLAPEDALDPGALARDLMLRGIRAEAAPSIDAMVALVAEQAPRDAVLLCMSNGAFGHIHARLLAALAARAA